MKEFGSTESDTSFRGAPSSTDSLSFEAPVQHLVVTQAPPLHRSHASFGSRSTLVACPSKKKSKNFTSTLFYITLVLTQQFFQSPTELLLSQNTRKSLPGDEPSKNMQALKRPFNANPYGKHELFDPMMGKFTVDFDQNPFLQPKLRWRNDAVLAAYAWQKQNPAAVNMLMTETQMPNYHTTSDRACSSSIGVSPRDPTLMDYDVIDVTWRNDIEREKNKVPEVPTQQQPSQTPTSSNVVENQFERDLQTLHEKGFIATLSSDETSRFEELSKAQYADFYTSVARSFKNPSELTASSSVSVSSKHGGPSSFEPAYTPAQPSSYNRNLNNHGSSSQPFHASRRTYDNITDVYRNHVSHVSPILSDYTAPLANVDDLAASFRMEDGAFDLYVNDDNVIADVNLAVSDQRETAFDNIVKKVYREARYGDEAFSWTPFDDPLPIDDSFFDLSDISIMPKSQRHERSSSTSSGFVSSDSRSPSPGSSNSLSSDFRFYGKLAPLQTESGLSYDDEGIFEDDKNDHSRRRGRQSKDNELVKKYDLPASAEQLASMSHKTLQSLFKNPMLSEVQRTMIKKIRRRGRNKEAARKCRERRLNQTDTDTNAQPTLILFPPKSDSFSED